MWSILKSVGIVVGPDLAKWLFGIITRKKKKGAKLMADVSILEQALKDAVGDLKKVKGWSFDSFIKVMAKIMSAGPMVGVLWVDADPEVQKQAVVNVANYYIDVPLIDEGFEESLFGMLYEAAKKGYDEIIN